MRRLLSQQFTSTSVQEVLDEFTQRMPKLGILESDVVSVSTMPAARVVSQGGVNYATIGVLIVYWGKE